MPNCARWSTAVGEVYRYSVEAPGLSSTEIRTLQDWTIRPALRIQMRPCAPDAQSAAWCWL